MFAVFSYFSRYSGIPDLATSFKRASRDSHGLLHLVDLGPTPKKDGIRRWVDGLKTAYQRIEVYMS